MLIEFVPKSVGAVVGRGFRASLLALAVAWPLAMNSGRSFADTIRSASLVKVSKLSIAGKKVYCDFGASTITPVFARKSGGQMRLSALSKSQLRLARSKKSCPARCTVALKAANTTASTSAARSVRFAFTSTDSCKLELSVSTPELPEGGVVSVGRSAVDYAPRAQYSGTDQFTLRATNARGDSAEKSFSVAVSGPPCVLTSLLSGSPLQIVESTPSEFPVASESCGLDFEAEVVQAPAHGSAAGVGSRVRYSPELHYLGTDNLQVRLNSKRGATLTVSVPLAISMGAAEFAGVKDSLHPYRSTITRNEARAVLKRVGLGDRRILDHFPGEGPISRAEFVDHLINFDPGAAVDQEVENIGYLTSNHKNFPTVNPNGWFWETWSARPAISYEILHSNPMKEVMFLNLHDHFATNLAVVREPDQIGLTWPVRDHYYKLKDQALGSFDTFLKLMNYDTGMAWFLSNHLNHYDPAAADRYRSVSGNFNFGREMLERFTLGRADPYTGLPLYTETDVNASARILSGFYSWFQTYDFAQPGYHGWNVGCATAHGDCEGMGLRFDKAYAFNGDISIFGNGVIDGIPVAGLAGGAHTFNVRSQAGSQSGPAASSPAADSYMDVLLYDHPATARHFAYSFFGRLAYPHPAETLTNELAALLISSDYDIKTMLRKILNSSAMYSEEPYNSCIKSPAEHLAYVLKNLGLPMTKHFSIDIFVQALGAAGMNLLEPPSVFGWGMCGDPVRYGQANHGENWLSYQGLLNRGRYLWRLFEDQQRTTPTTRWYYLHPDTTEAGEGVDLQQLLDSSSLNPSPELLASNIVEMFQLKLTETQQSMLVEYLNGQRGFESSQELWANASAEQRKERLRGLAWIAGMHPRSMT